MGRDRLALLKGTKSITGMDTDGEGKAKAGEGVYARRDAGKDADEKVEEELATKVAELQRSTGKPIDLLVCVIGDKVAAAPST